MQCADQFTGIITLRRGFKKIYFLQIARSSDQQVSRSKANGTKYNPQRLKRLWSIEVSVDSRAFIWCRSDTITQNYTRKVVLH